MKVGIIGAGTMGAGIAQAFAETEGYEVYLCDINEEFAAGGKARIEKGLSKLVSKGKVTQEYADGIFLYNPRKEANKRPWGSLTSTRQELVRRMSKTKSQRKIFGILP